MPVRRVARLHARVAGVAAESVGFRAAAVQVNYVKLLPNGGIAIRLRTRQVRLLEA
jgi:hypothetical protein